MSVYYEAVQSDRLHVTDIVTFGARRALKRVKRAEAEERNARTPRDRTKAHRRELADLGKRIGGRK